MCRTVAALVLLSFFFLTPDFGAAIDVLTSSQSIKDPEAIVSAGNKFKLGFFSPVNSSFRYVGIWNSDVPTTTYPMWVANRNSPINDSSGVMRISDDGNLIVSNGHGEILWSSDVSSGVSNSSAQLRDDGNLVLRSNTSGSSILWQSFQQPCDTYLPNMKLSTNPSTGAKIQLTSWKSPSDPSIGSFSGVVDPFGIPEFKILKENQTFWRTGPWDGIVFLGIQEMQSVYLNGFSLVPEDDGSKSFLFINANTTLLVKIVLSFDGKFAQLTGNYGKGTWDYSWIVPENDCGMYGKCGEFGICNPQKTPICSCLRGFEPKKLQEWNLGNWTNGCARKALLQCDRAQNDSEAGNVDRFFKMQSVKVPEYAEWSPASPEQSCRDVCLSNCSCIAYAYYNGFGCMSWGRHLIDIEQFPQGGVDLNLRLAYSELDGKRKNLKVIISIAVSIGAVTIVICVLFSRWLVVKHMGRKEKNGQTLLSEQKVNNLEGNMVGENTSPGRLQEIQLLNLEKQKVLGGMNQVEVQELPLFNLQKLATATDNFALSNKLGQGGFGPVYKGELTDGQEIAVKRLSRASGQGVEEFMNEVLVISKLQHRNLVRLLGCCVEEEEKMLVYEYMPNKSLDSFLFDPVRRQVLDWKKRSNIVEGICRGLLYLHRDSRLRIIHRDLKASNILLDKELNPKISDFGMARIFGGNEDQANTNRVVGTYGYMSPEYAMDGRFSEKSDVFSFGVLLLEIVCGRRNSSFYSEPEMSLLGLAWRLWNESKMSSLVDPIISDECFEDDILRCIHVGLLCVQESAKDRPAVSTVISMLNSEIVDLPTPKQPAFVEKLYGSDTESIPPAPKTHTISAEIITDLNGR